MAAERSELSGVGENVQRPPVNRTALFAFIMSLLGLAVLVPLVGSIIGIVFGNRAMKIVDATGERGGGLAQAAVVFGYFGLVTIGLVLVMFLVIVFAAASSNG